MYPKTLKKQVISVQLKESCETMRTQETSCTLPSCDTPAAGTMHLARSGGRAPASLTTDNRNDIKPLTSHRLCCYMLSES
jgi:hypothetical protein